MKSKTLLTRPVVDRETSIGLYKSMLKIRLAEERVVDLYPTDKIQSPIHLSIGQEAVSAGVCKAMAQDDHIYGTPRGHGIYIAKDGDLKALFAELYAKDTGCCRGRGGSMHMAAPEVGVTGCSAIVASTIPVATGAALAAQLRKSRQVMVAFFGDGAIGAGVFYESANFAALKNLPVVYVCENNHFAVHSRVQDRHRQTELFRFSEGLGIRGERFDGNDVGEVYSSMRAALDHVRANGAPLLLEYMTYRWCEHVGPGQDHKEDYREKDRLAEALRNDPLPKARKFMQEAFSIPDSDFEAWERSVRQEVDEAVEFAERSPFPEPRHLLRDLFKEQAAPNSITVTPAEHIARTRPDAREPARRITFGQALHEALESAMAKDPSVFVMGIGVDDHKGVFGSTKGLAQRFGASRVFDTPIAENAMTGVAIGAALEGMKPVHIHMRADFLYLAMDQLCNIAAKWRYMFGGKASVPLVVRAVIGRSWGQGAQHSQSLQSLFMHVPGLKVVMPTTAYDAKGYLTSAIFDPNPVLMIEHRLLYGIQGEVPQEDYALPFGKAYVRREGKDLTIVANAYMAAESIKAAEFLATQGIEVEIVDPVSLVPLDEETLLRSVRKTGRLLVADQSWITCGASAEIAAMVAEKGFDALKSPIRRIGCQAVPCPVAKPLENAFYPSARTIAETVCAMLGRKLPDTEIPLLTHQFKGPF